MPIYLYSCPACGTFEMYAGRDDRQVECACGLAATRRPFSGVPYLKGETVPRQIPDEAYRTDAQKKEFNSNWGSSERTMEMVRSSVRTDKAKAAFETTGVKQIDQQNMRKIG